MNPNVKLDKEKSAVAEVHALSHDGRGIALVNNKKTFVSGALPSEIITYKITQKRSNYNNADVLEILKASPDRISPPCQHFGICGGCSLQHISTATQLELKQQTLLNQLKHFGGVEPQSILPPLSANTLKYRYKARLGVKFVIKKNKLLVGFREKSSRYLADLERCVILHPKIGEHLNDLSQLISSLAQYQAIPQIEVAIGDHVVALIFRHLEILLDSDLEKLISFGKCHDIHIYLQPNPPAPLYKLWPQDHAPWLTYSLPDYQLEFLFRPLDFTQINPEMNRLMVKQAISLLDLHANDNVLDLFCGIGNFTLPIARYAHHITGIEGNQDMVEQAKRNAIHNNLENASFYAANLTEPLMNSAWTNSQYDKILLDPPRTGAKEILPYFKKWAAKKIVYVSCNPATLARDAGELVNIYGYDLKQAGIMNMFPHTSHIEAMAVFEKE